MGTLWAQLPLSGKEWKEATQVLRPLPAPLRVGGSCHRNAGASSSLLSGAGWEAWVLLEGPRCSLGPF